MSDATELLRSLNPEPDCAAPPIERLWVRLELDAVSAPERENVPSASALPRRKRLRDAEDARTRPPGRTGGSWASGLLVGLFAAAAVAIGVGAVLVLHAHRRPTATASALPSPRFGVVGILGVLRRPQTKADLDLGSYRTGLLRRTPGVFGIPVMSRLRLATVTPWGEKLFLIPFLPPTVASIAKLPPALRSMATRRLAADHWRAGMRLGSFGAGGCCSTAAQIEAGRDWSTGGGDGGSLNYVVLVVPDGVARVRVDLPHPVTTQVHGNVAAFEVPRPVENLSVYKVTWYGPSGTVLKRFASSVRHVSAAQQAQTRATLVRKDESSTAQINPKILRNFALFATPASGAVGHGTATFTVSEPALSSLPTVVLGMGSGPAAGYPMAVRATREVTTSSGLDAWVQAGTVICVTGTTSERIDVCSGDQTGALASGLVVFPELPSGTRMIFGIVPDINKTITLDLNAGGTRTVLVTDSMFITPADGVARIAIEGVTGKTTTQPGLDPIVHRHAR